jgi:GNAT superfamily N-acetyltransferase
MQYPFSEVAHRAGHATWGVYNDATPPELIAVTAAFMGRDPDNHRKQDLHLTMAYVTPAYRGHGIQRQLIATRLAYGRRNGAKIAYTYTHIHNRPSQINLLHAGFTPYAVRSVNAPTYISYAKRLP